MIDHQNKTRSWLAWRRPGARVGLVLVLAMFSTPASSEAPPEFILQWGSRGTEPGLFMDPVRIAIAPNGNVLVAEEETPPRIQEFTADGQYVKSFGSFGAGPGEFGSIFGLASAADGTVYATDYGACRVERFDANGNFLNEWGSLGAADGQFENPAGVAVAPDGSVYIADRYNQRIQRFTSGGEFVAKWNAAPGTYPFDIAVDGSGNVYVLETACLVEKFSATGELLLSWGTCGTGDGQFRNAWGLGLDASGNVYVADGDNYRIQKFTGEGVFLSTWGSFGEAPGEFNQVVDVAVEALGDIYTVDLAGRVQKFGYPVPTQAATLGKLKATYR